MDKKNVLIVHNYYKIHGGEDTVVQNEIKMLKKRNYNVYTYFRYNEEIDLLNIFGKIKMIPNTIFSFKTIKEVREILKSKNIDIVHVHNTFPLISPSIYWISKKYNAKVINTIHNYPHKDYVMRYGCLLGKYMYKKQLRYIKNINCPIACSQSISIELKNKFKIETLYIQNGVSIKSSCKNKKNELRNKLNIPINKKVLISVGALIERKNPKFLIECFLNSNIKKDAILLLLGDGNLKNSLEKISNENIIFAGNVDNVNEYLTLSDIFISASKAEGLPNAVMEAMSNELPVILSNINPHSEIIKNSNCGLLFNLEKEELINCLNKIDKLDIKDMGKNSRLIIEENFTDKKMSKSYEELYINLFMNDKR